MYITSTHLYIYIYLNIYIYVYMHTYIYIPGHLRNGDRVFQDLVKPIPKPLGRTSVCDYQQLGRARQERKDATEKHNNQNISSFFFFKIS